MSSYDPIDEALNISNAIEVNNIPENGCVKRQDQLKNVSDVKHYFSSSSFSKAIYTRKVQIKINGEKVSEVKGIIDAIEVWPNHEVEWWLVPIKTGYFKDLFCKVLDKKSGLKHSEMGMQGVIIIE